MKLGLPVMRSSDANSLLLAEYANIAPNDQVLMMATDPALVLDVARKAASVDVYSVSFSALLRLHHMLKALPHHDGCQINISDTIYPHCAPNYSVAIIVQAKGRDTYRAQLWSTYQSMCAGGKLYISGANDGGVKPALADVEQIFERSILLATKARHRIGVAVRPNENRSYPSNWGVDPTVMHRRQYDTPQGTYEVATIPGVFSWEHLDNGTYFLLEHLHVNRGESVLDVGCGTGIVGLVASHMGAHVQFMDDSLLAISCTRESLRLNGITNAVVQPSDVFSELHDETFDLIVSNPPFHREFELTTNVAARIIREAPQHLRPNGRLVLVANAFLGYEKIAANYFSSVKVIAQNNRYYIIEAKLQG